MALEVVEAVVFDLDGVLTDTAALHATAWQELFDSVLDEGPVGQEPFGPDDYRRYVDGRPRADGVRAFLQARGIHHDEATVARLAARKDEVYLELLRTIGPRPFPGSVAFAHRLADLGVPMAVVSASRHCDEVLEASGLAGLFGIRVDGLDAETLGLNGKPDPATFLAAARRLAVAPSRAAVIEDAQSGVRAGRAGGFGLVIGVARTGRPESLIAAGADRIIGDLAELEPVPAGGGRVRLMGAPGPGRPAASDLAAGQVADAEWLWSYEEWVPSEEGKRESLCTLGNGYQATRGAFPGCPADSVHYPGVYVAGCYNRAFTMLDGQLMGNESLANLPDWLVVRFRPVGGAWLTPQTCEVVEHRLTLDMRAGLLLRHTRLVDAQGRRTRLSERRLVHMGDPHLAAIEMTVVPENWSGPIEVHSGLESRVANTGVRSDRGFAAKHLGHPVTSRLDEDTVRLIVVTGQSKVRIAEAARTTLFSAGADSPPAEVVTEPGYVGLRWEVDLREGRGLTLEKVVSLFTSRDIAISEPAAAAAESVSQAGDFDSLASSHRTAWDRQWADLEMRTDNADIDRTVHLHAFHLSQTLSRHTGELDVGVPARGLHGEGYRGHVFWDEVLVLPFLTFRHPQLVRRLLHYRYRRLGWARRAAAEAGFAGAMFPWQSGSDGGEETPEVLFNPRSGRWLADHSRLQRHVGLAVAYNVWHYYQATGDIDFLAGYGAELLIEIARFFTSAASFDGRRRRFELRGVMGPDEFHDRYPGAVAPGVDNNAYTNLMVVWLLQRTAQAIELVEGYHPGEVRAALHVTDQEMAHWHDVSTRMFVPFHDGVISQFEGYEQLQELDWDAYRARYGNIGRLDLILESEGDTANRYKLSKQADVLMLLYLLSAEELRGLLDGLGYQLPPEMVTDTVEYYLARTTHGSTLSQVVDAWVLARSDREASWRSFTEATAADIRDSQGGTTAEGIHLAAMAGGLDMLQRCYTGLEARDDQLWLNPLLPAELPELRLHLLYRGHWLRLTLSNQFVEIHTDASTAPPIKVRVGENVIAVPTGQAVRQRLRNG